VVTVVSEVVLLVPFLWIALREAISLAVLGLAWRPALAAVLMGVPVWLLAPLSVPLAIFAGVLVYGAAIVALRVVTAEERAELRRIVRR
jgi:hypothetical protein